MNLVTIYKWTSSFSYEIIVKSRVMYHFQGKERQLTSYIYHLKHDRYSLTPSHVHAVIGSEFLYRIEIDLVNLEHTKKTRINNRKAPDWNGINEHLVNRIVDYKQISEDFFILLK
jgi:hypothetical protein